MPRISPIPAGIVTASEIVGIGVGGYRNVVFPSKRDGYPRGVEGEGREAKLSPSSERGRRPTSVQ